MVSTPGKIILHRMGYFSDQSGIVRRYAREEKAWEPHLRACKDLIIRAVTEINPCSIAVLGAGSLIDLPLDEMCPGNRTITLVDIVPPLPAVRETVLHGDASFVEADITGGLIERVYNLTPRRFFKKRIDVCSLLDFSTWMPAEGTEMVISLNVMTQLAALPVDYLRRKSHITPDEERLIFRTVQERHLEMLGRYDSLLITDFSERTGRDEESQAESPLLEVDLPSGVINEQWNWLFDSHNGYNGGKITTFRVAGIVLRG